jgi:hypothetical protein
MGTGRECCQLVDQLCKYGEKVLFLPRKGNGEWIHSGDGNENTKTLGGWIDERTSI